MGYNPAMPYSRIIPALLIGLLLPLPALAQEPAPAPAPAAAPVPEGPTPAEIQLDTATIKVRLMERIAARIEQDVDMLNQKFKLEGNYYKDTNFRVRLQLNLVGLGDTGSTMLQVCDGKVLWDYQKVLNMQSYRKREISPILKKLDDPNLDAFFRSLIISQLGFGGPEAMLAGLRKAVRFDQVGEDKIDGVEVWVLGGTWRDRSNLMGPGDRPLAPTAPLPPYIPSNVQIYVGKVDGWPYKIKMVGNAPSLLQEDTRAIDPASGRPVGVKKAPPKVTPSQITLSYRLLPLAQIKPEMFFFQTPADVTSANVIDDTEQYLGYLDTAIQSETARKKAEAAKAEGEPLLNAPPIDVKPDPATKGLGIEPVPAPSSPK